METLKQRLVTLNEKLDQEYQFLEEDTQASGNCDWDKRDSLRGQIALVGQLRHRAVIGELIIANDQWDFFQKFLLPEMAQDIGHRWKGTFRIAAQLAVYLHSCCKNSN